jgi:hypothetical protein
MSRAPLSDLAFNASRDHGTHLFDFRSRLRMKDCAAGWTDSPFKWCSFTAGQQSRFAPHCLMFLFSCGKTSPAKLPHAWRISIP